MSEVGTPFTQASELMPRDIDPIGTVDEVRALGMDTRSVGTCAASSGPNGIKGCPWHKKCRFRQWRDQQNGLKGPLNIGVEIVLGPNEGGAWAQNEIVCHQYYSSSYAGRVKDSPETGDVVRVIAYEGDDKMVKHRETRKKFPNRPDDKTMETVIIERPVSRFMRPAERFPVVRYAQDAREELMDDIEKQALLDALEKNAPQPPVGAPVKVTKKEKAK